MPDIPLPRTGGSALRALATAGYTHLEQLDGVPMRTILDLPGMGPKGIGALRRAMAEHGLAFAEDDPSVGAVQGGLVSRTAGLQPERNDNRTAPGEASARAWVETLPTERRRQQGRAMIEMLDEVTGEQPVLWGSSIVGYGQVHYVYESGREGDTCRLGFSPRASALSLYGLQGHDGAEELLERLGKHRRGAGCVYITRLEDVDLDVLRRLMALAWEKGVDD